MAKVDLNHSLKSIRGRIAGFVYRVRDGKQTVSKAPDMSGVKWSPAQVAHRERFRRAVERAQAAMRDENMRAAYERRAAQEGRRAFDMAVSDYYKKGDERG